MSISAGIVIRDEHGIATTLSQIRAVELPGWDLVKSDLRETLAKGNGFGNEAALSEGLQKASGLRLDTGPEGLRLSGLATLDRDLRKLLNIEDAPTRNFVEGIESLIKTLKAAVPEAIANVVDTLSSALADAKPVLRELVFIGVPKPDDSDKAWFYRVRLGIQFEGLGFAGLSLDELWVVISNFGSD